MARPSHKINDENKNLSENILDEHECDDKMAHCLQDTNTHLCSSISRSLSSSTIWMFVTETVDRFISVMLNTGAGRRFSVHTKTVGKHLVLSIWKWHTARRRPNPHCNRFQYTFSLRSQTIESYFCVTLKYLEQLPPDFSLPVQL